MLNPSDLPSAECRVRYQDNGGNPFDLGAFEGEGLRRARIRFTVTVWLLFATATTSGLLAYAAMDRAESCVLILPSAMTAESIQ